ncbi:ABC-type Fe3+ transport system [Candidatus Moduliflexus flocculans]|uniref:ABC-type Fe3+ transport system n=1 Tax=Candidatus Moduliflexus flocculans TaxID=1499966 RepID=A0A0S6VZW9_9BACT|nr:ABC-type Fe3+ transport system [Candidatus Moduliflexus flocculans]
MTTPAKPTAYTKCEQCGFWHAPDEWPLICANCGTSLVKEYETVYDTKKILAAIGLFGFFSFSFGVLIGGFPGFIVAVMIIICGPLRFRPYAQRILKSQRLAQGLRYNEEVIKQRLSEIGQKKQKIQGVIEELKQMGDSQRNRVRFQALDKGAAELSRQRDRYIGKLHEIELIRWSNQLSPLLSHSPQLTEQQATERLNTLSEIQTKGQKLAQT